MTRNHILATGVIGFFILFGLTLSLGVGKIEADLTKRSKNLLDKQHLEWVEITANGRDLLLTGLAPNPLEGKRALELIKGLEGVSKVKKKFSYQSSYGTSTIKSVNGTSAAD